MKDWNQSLFIPFSLTLFKNCKMLQIKDFSNFNRKILNHKTRAERQIVLCKITALPLISTQACLMLTAMLRYTNVLYRWYMEGRKLFCIQLKNKYIQSSPKINVLLQHLKSN